MYKSKSELMNVVRDLEEDAGNDLKDSFIHTIDFFKGMLAILQGAEVRIISAGTAYNLGQTNVDRVMS